MSAMASPPSNNNHAAANGEPAVKRPKGILKRKADNQPAALTTTTTTAPMATSPPAPTTALSTSPTSSAPLPLTTSNIKELTLQNTSMNAGKRRSSSVSRKLSTTSRSGRSMNGSTSKDGGAALPQTPPSHLKWDETNILLHEQNKVPRMKIDEPKTPFAPHYDPDADDDLDMEGDIPGLDIGEAADVGMGGQGSRSMEWGGLISRSPPSNASVSAAAVSAGSGRRLSASSHGSGTASEKHVGVNPKDASPAHDAEHEPQSEDERRKHCDFEMKRKRHYEMTGIKDLLGKAIDMDEEDDDEDDEMEDKSVPPPMPPIPERFKSQQK